MKIILFDGTFKTTTFINRLAEGLSENHDVYIIGFNEQLNKKIHNVSYIALGSNNSNIRFLKTSIKLRGFNLKQQLNLCSLLLKGKKRDIKEKNLQFVVNKIQPDIIHFQWVSVLSYVSNLSFPNHTKIIFSQRGFHINVRPFIDSDNMMFLRNVYPLIDGFHSVSKAIQHKSNLIYNSSSKKDQVVYSGFDHRNFPMKKNYDRGAIFQILSVGRNHWIKDYTTAMKAMHILKNKDVAFVYTIVGVEQDEELLFLVNDLELNENVKFINKVSQKKVYEMMCASDVLLLPSIEEGIANVCIEAMFCKLPVLSTNCGGMRELIDTSTGFIVEKRSPKSMAEKLEDISKLENNTLELLTYKAREKVMVNHGASAMLHSMEVLYNKVIDGKK